MDPNPEEDRDDDAELEQLEADVDLVDAAMTHLADGDIDAAEAALAGITRDESADADSADR